MKKYTNEILNNNDISLNVRFKELHSLCSYLAMFPPGVPNEYIKKYTKEGDLVYEPFSGRGTTTLEARRLNRRIFSNDLSPLAYVLTKAKTYKINHNELLKRINFYEKKFNKWLEKEGKELKRNNKAFKDFEVFYSVKNLKQLYFLRKELGEKYNKLNNIDNYILAIALGIMHGPTRKDGSSLYFSVNTPNGMSVAPNYARNYIKKNNLKRLETNIFWQIESRIDKKRNDFGIEQNNNLVFHNDALKSSEFIFEKPKLIFTSPPYLNIVKYISQNWIRFWLLGFSKEDTKENIVDDYHASKEYEKFLISFMLEMEKIMDEKSIFIMVIGDVKNYKIVDRMKEMLKKTNLKLIKDPIPQILKNKTTRQTGNRVGKATKQDWIFIFEK